MWVGLWCLTAVFASAKADAETDGKCHRGQGHSPRQVADGQRLIREMRGFPPLSHTFTKNHQRPNAEAMVRAILWLERSGRRRVAPCPPSEDLEDLERSGKAFNSGEEKAGIIKHIGKADTLPSEGFYD